jgi:dihydroxyacetone kinase-like protein
MRAAAKLKGQAEASGADYARLVAVMAQGIADRGKGGRGDKTMLDAWWPAADAVEEALELGRTPAEAMAAAAAAAEAGAAATAAMTPKLGRSARLGERALGHVDPGAASAAILIRVMAESPALARD